jgi:hypothetical protein
LLKAEGRTTNIGMSNGNNLDEFGIVFEPLMLVYGIPFYYIKG